MTVSAQSAIPTPLAQRQLHRVLTVAVLAALIFSAGAARGATVQRGHLRVSFNGEIMPKALPRRGRAPIAVSLSVKIATGDHTVPPQLHQVELAINRAGRLDPAGLPTCRLQDIQPSTTANALRACAAAKVGEGRFNADVLFPEQSPFPSEGKLVAFNGVQAGHPVIFAHVYGTDPVPTSYTLVLRIAHAKGTYGTVLRASLPRVTSDVAFITGISIRLKRRFAYRGHTHSYLSAGCPAPDGIRQASFPFARASFGFEGGRTLRAKLTRSCGARG